MNWKTLADKDSSLFSIVYSCKPEQVKTLLTDDLEFYHDKGGLSTSKKDVVDKTQKNVCGKVTRELVPGSIEVYPIAGYGAIEIGFHKFHNNQEPAGAPSHPGRFVFVWHRTDAGWKITRVISLH